MRHLSGGLRKSMKNLCQDSQCPGWDLNRSSPEYKCRQTCYTKYTQYQMCFKQKLQILMISVFYMGPVYDTMQIQAVLPIFQIRCSIFKLNWLPSDMRISAICIVQWLCLEGEDCKNFQNVCNSVYIYIAPSPRNTIHSSTELCESLKFFTCILFYVLVVLFTCS
jgi:hypothetical protein